MLIYLLVSKIHPAPWNCNNFQLRDWGRKYYNLICFAPTEMAAFWSGKYEKGASEIAKRLITAIQTNW